MSDVSTSGITTGSFNGVLAPPQVSAEILNLLLAGAPLASSLFRQPTDRSARAPQCTVAARLGTTGVRVPPQDQWLYAGSPATPPSY